MAIIDDVALGIQGGTHNAKIFRQLAAALVGQDIETFSNSIGQTGPGHGVILPDHLAVSENGTPNMSVNVAAGLALVTGDQSLAQGVYVAGNDATVNLTISTADATNARKDLVVLQVRDDTEDGGGNDDCQLAVITGTPAASPADPTITDNSLVLARVNVPANDTAITDAQIDDLRTYALSLAGTRRAGTQLRRAANLSATQTTAVEITWDTEDQDTDGYIAVSATDITVPAGLAGLYMATLRVTGAGTWTAGTLAYLRNNATVIGTGAVGASSVTNQVTATFTGPLAEGDVIDCFIYNVGTAQNCTARLNFYRVGV